jgi:type I restriction enzyme S subunit
MTSSGTGNCAALWPRAQLKEVVKFRSGQRDTNTAVKEGEFPFFVCSSEVLRCEQFDFDDEAVVMAGNNADGIFHLHHFVGKFAARQRTYVITPSTDRLDCRWLFLQLTLLQPQFQAAAIGTTTRYVTIEMLRSAEIFVPDVNVQRDLAGIFGDVDALLEGLDLLIAKKRDLKQAAMQQLLTGQTRLPGFHGEWEMKRLGDVGTFLKGTGVKKDQAQSGDLPCIRYGEIYTHHTDYIRSYNSWISPEIAATATRLRQGDLLFAGSGETKEEIGKCVAFIDDRAAFAGGDIVILRLRDAHPMFMGYYCNTPHVNAQKASKGQGDAVVHISAAALSSVAVTIPSFPEQTAIATVLSDMDAELAALEARRDKTRDIKQAMMQELLTGKTRLVSTGPAHA